MEDLPPSRPDAGASDGFTGPPRWVKVFGIGAAILVLVVIVVMLLSGQDHGPGRHSPGGHGSSLGGVAVASSAHGLLDLG